MFRLQDQPDSQPEARTEILIVPPVLLLPLQLCQMVYKFQAEGRFYFLPLTQNLPRQQLLLFIRLWSTPTICASSFWVSPCFFRCSRTR